MLYIARRLAAWHAEVNYNYLSSSLYNAQVLPLPSAGFDLKNEVAAPCRTAPPPTARTHPAQADCGRRKNQGHAGVLARPLARPLKRRRVFQAFSRPVGRPTPPGFCPPPAVDAGRRWPSLLEAEAADGTVRALCGILRLRTIAGRFTRASSVRKPRCLCARRTHVNSHDSLDVNIYTLSQTDVNMFG